MPPKVITYTYFIRADARIRVWLEDDAGQITHFAVSLEYEVELGEGDWRAVARYDTTGGTVHRDRLRPNGTYLTHREPTRLGSTLDQAIENAKVELSERADAYLGAFVQMLESEGR